MILKTLTVGPYASNCYIVGAEPGKEGMIIDPGAEAEKVLKTVKSLHLDIKLIVVTHGHIDHIGGLAAVKAGTNAGVAVHASDARQLSDSSTHAWSGLSHEAVNPDRLLKGGDSIEIGDLKFLVLHTPGHSQGSICLLGHGVLFSGDTLFNHGIGRYDFPGGSYADIMNSIRTRLMVLPDDTVVYPGHGPQTTIGEERRANPFLRG